MKPEITLFSTILLLGAAHGLFLALALLHARGGNQRAHRILALLCVIFILSLGDEFMRQTHYYTPFPRLIWVTDPLEFLYGPLTWFYILALTSPYKFTFSWQQWYHFIPTALASLFATPFYLLDTQIKLAFLYLDEIPDVWLANLAYLGQLALILMFIVQFALYLVWSFRALKQHARRIHQRFSYTHRVDLAWLRYLLGFFSTLFLLFLLDVFIADWLGLGDQLTKALGLMTVVMFYTLGYLGLRQPTIFERHKTTDLLTEQSSSTSPIANQKYKASALDAETSKLLLIDLEHYMLKHKPYLDSKITLPSLSAQLGISSNYLSQVINQHLDQNFFDFINSRRVQQAKTYLSDAKQDKPNMLRIGFDSGFNSKSVFYSAFKKHTGMTPSQYRKSVIEN